MTPEEIKKLLELPDHLDKLTDGQLATREVIHPCPICKNKFDIINIKPHIKACKQEQEIIDYCKSKEFHIFEIEEKFGLSKAAVQKILNRNNLRPKNTVDGTVTKKNVELIKPLWDKGLSTSEIAKITGLTRANVGIIGKRQGWKLNTDILERQKINEAKFWEFWNENPNSTQAEIVRGTGIPRTTVGNYLRKFGLKKS